MKIWGLTVLCFACSMAFSQGIEVKIANAVKQLEGDAQLKHALFSLYVIDTKTGKVVFDKNAQVGLAPASCLKVVTSAAAFDLLGKEYAYKTTVAYDGSIEAGTLKGNIYIKASGDPTLGSWRWNNTNMDTVKQRIVAALKASRITSITGDVLIDESPWSTQATPGGWTWDDMGNYYGAGARAFNWHENQYDVNLKPGKSVGDAVDIMGTEPVLQAQLVSEVKTGKAGSGDNTVIYLPENATLGYIRGTVPAGVSSFKVSGAMPNAAVSFSRELETWLRDNHIELSGQVKSGTEKQNAKKILTLTSPPVDSINYWFLQKSVNLFGEALVKTIAYEKTGFGTTDTGVHIIRDFWAKRGIETSALHNIDGSGLSPANRVTTHALVTVMQYAQKQSWFPSFYNALPKQNNIKMKSGYIGGVRSYTGYIRSASGAGYTFAFIINNYDGDPGTVREKMWKLLDILK